MNPLDAGAGTFEEEDPSDPLLVGLRTAFGLRRPSPSQRAERGVIQALEQQVGAISSVILRSHLEAGSLTGRLAPSIASAALSEFKHYHVLEEIGRGGLGVVHRALDIDLGRETAMKILLETHREDAGIVQRFVEEAQIAGQLQHPGILPVYEIGLVPDGRPFFTMKLVIGQTLSALLGAREDSVADRRRFLAILDQVFQAVAYAHSRGVVHRDLKPANIMIGVFGEVQVMDWGLSKVLGRKEISGGSSSETRREGTARVKTHRSENPAGDSQTGVVIGTPSYMSPEQANGAVERIDERSDVFSLGAILCEILTGKPPYIARTREEILRQAASSSLEEAHSRLMACISDKWLLETTRKCLSPSPEGRFRDAGELARETSAYLGSVEERARAWEVAAAEERGKASQERRSRRLTLSLAASIVVALLLGGAGYLQIENDQRSRSAQAHQEVSRALEETRLRWGEARASPRGELSQWTDAVSAAREAQSLARSPDVDEATRTHLTSLLSDLFLEEREAREKAATELLDRQTVQRLEDLRLRRADLPKKDRVKLEAEYAQAFKDYGADFTASPYVVARERLRMSAIATTLAVGLDHWAFLRREINPQDPEAWRELSRLARQMDPDSWRQRLREAIEADHLERLRELASAPGVSNFSASTLDLFGEALAAAGDMNAAKDLLFRAVETHPGDFWINENLGVFLARTGASNLTESLRYLTAAVALRPQAPAAWSNLGATMANLKKSEAALHAFRKAVELGPTLAMGHSNLGAMLLNQKDIDGALVVLEKAVRLDPELAQAHGNLAAVRRRKGDFEGALQSCREAVRLMPDFAEANLTLGELLEGKGMYSEALDAFRRIEEWSRQEPERLRQHEDRIQRCERFSRVESRLEVALRGDLSPTGVQELEDLATICYARELYAASASFSISLFEKQPVSAENLRGGTRYNAACAAALAAQGRGEDAQNLDEPARLRFLHISLAWLRADLADWGSLAGKDEALLKERRPNLEHWKRDPDLAGLRDEESLSSLPRADGESCRRLWAEVEDLLSRAP